ncbi:MAG: NAD-dependent epimerase/dehydratase family protein [Acidimicrobiia bacterium]|nr:NAD-dependent epimerase/dehydratase family protein [Acidimicrobiia bacterium]NNL27288.1 NAD-dependent epimerase/dehydratase family protein [Acidimicrobiia bacterium]
MTRALVTGGAGFLGRSLSERLVRDGYEVVVLDNLSSASPLGVAEGTEFIEGDVIDPPDIGGTFTHIYHFASPASPPRYLKDPIGTMRTGAEGTLHMLERAESDDAVITFASTSEIYGDPLEHPQQESYFGNVDITSPRACYDEAKRYAEALVHAFHRSGRHTKTRIVRVFNTYGPGMSPDDGRVVSNFLVQAINGQPMTIQGDGSQTRSFCYVDDLVEGIIRLSRSDVTLPVNLGNPNEITMLELADRVAEIAGDPGRIFTELPQSDPKVRQPDISRAVDLLDWRPVVDLVDGLAETHQYFKQVLAG